MPSFRPGEGKEKKLVQKYIPEYSLAVTFVALFVSWLKTAFEVLPAIFKKKSKFSSPDPVWYVKASASKRLCKVELLRLQ
jgi:hypothetical protein